MTSMISIDGVPVVFIGATRWYATDHLERLTSPAERLSIVALCQTMTSEPAFSPDSASELRQARTD